MSNNQTTRQQLALNEKSQSNLESVSTSIITYPEFTDYQYIIKYFQMCCVTLCKGILYKSSLQDFSESLTQYF